MATCIYCNAQIAEGLRFCTECGAALPVETAVDTLTAPLEQAIAESGAQQPYQQPSYDQQPQPPYQQSQQPGQAANQYWQQPVQQPVQQPGQPGYQQPQYGQVSASYDSGNIGWGVLGFFFPIVGLILFLVWRNDKPNCARVAGIGALIGFCLGLVMRFGFLGAFLR